MFGKFRLVLGSDGFQAPYLRTPPMYNLRAAPAELPEDGEYTLNRQSSSAFKADRIPEKAVIPLSPR